jgi:plasmid stabilization system protein ParE
MKGGYKIFWTEHALSELEETLEYLVNNFSKKELEKLSRKIESTIYLISQNPGLFSKSDKQEVYRVTILNFNTLYYRIQGEKIEILSFFSNRQNPQKRKLK